jgi:hypothetical protein
MHPDVIICADWSKSEAKRAIWIADLRDGNALRPLDVNPRTFDVLIQKAKALVSSKHRVLLTFDAPLGLPRSYFEVARASANGRMHGFLDWLPAVCMKPEDFFSPVCGPEQWSVAHPFFRIPKGKGSLKAFEQAAAKQGIALRRNIDCRTYAKSVFAMGIPGQVACAAQELWREMANATWHVRGYKFWPFDGSLEKLLSRPGVIVAEIYPATAYATAIDDVQQQLFSPYGVGIRPKRRFRVVKSSPLERKAATTALRRSVWTWDSHVALQNLERAEDNEDDFDACMTAAALLRLVLEKRPLANRELLDPVSEGGILCV